MQRLFYFRACFDRRDSYVDFFMIAIEITFTIINCIGDYYFNIDSSESYYFNIDSSESYPTSVY